MHTSRSRQPPSLTGQRDARLRGQISGDSSDPSGQSFSPSQRQPLEMHVTWSLHTNCFGLQVFGASIAVVEDIISKHSINPMKYTLIAMTLAMPDGTAVMQVKSRTSWLKIKKPCNIKPTHSNLLNGPVRLSVKLSLQAQGISFEKGFSNKY